jgi:hypothetical protein
VDDEIFEAHLGWWWPCSRCGSRASSSEAGESVRCGRGADAFHGVLKFIYTDELLTTVTAKKTKRRYQAVV